MGINLRDAKSVNEQGRRTEGIGKRANKRDFGTGNN
jgi:hypothetical protein